MKSVISGKVYNTDTSDYVCGHYDAHGYGYFKGVEEDLYRTKKGALFLCVEFGTEAYWGHSYLSRCYQDGHFGPHQGRKIIAVLDDDQAKRFVEKYGDADDFVTCFGEPEEA